jgi:hypothetical protein
MTLPSVPGSEGVLVYSSAVSLVAATAPLMGLVLDIDYDKLRMKPLVIPAGASNGITIKNMTAVTGASVDINVWFTETSF